MSSEAITRNDLTAILNEVLPSVAVDYVVEEGTSGIWTYRKWNSGIAECWATITYSITSYTAWGNDYYSQPYKSVSFPTNLFTSTPTFNLTHIDGGEGIACSVSASKDGITNMYLLRPASGGTVTTYFSVHAIGTWK